MGRVSELGSVYGVESRKTVFVGAVPIHFFMHFCCRMYRLATTLFVTDRQKDRETDIQTYRQTTL